MSKTPKYSNAGKGDKSRITNKKSFDTNWDKIFRGYKMDNQLQELLTITMEECGELIQACSKAIRCDDYHDNASLIEEIGDVMCMIELLQQYDLVSYQEIDERVIEKRKKLEKWSNLI